MIGRASCERQRSSALVTDHHLGCAGHVNCRGSPEWNGDGKSIVDLDADCISGSVARGSRAGRCPCIAGSSRWAPPGRRYREVALIEARNSEICDVGLKRVPSRGRDQIAVREGRSYLTRIRAADDSVSGSFTGGLGDGQIAVECKAHLANAKYHGHQD